MLKTKLIALTALAVVLLGDHATAQRPKYERCYEVCKDVRVTHCERGGVDCHTKIERICYRVCD